EERLRDRLVRQALGGELGDPTLARRQRLETGQEQAPRPSTRRQELRACLLLERRRTCPVRELEAAAKPFARVGLAVGAVQRGSERHERAGVLELRPGCREDVDRLLEQPL